MRYFGVLWSSFGGGTGEYVGEQCRTRKGRQGRSRMERDDDDDGFRLRLLLLLLLLLLQAQPCPPRLGAMPCRVQSFMTQKHNLGHLVLSDGS